MNKIDKIKQIVERSGNNFHSKVLNYLKDNKWSVLISPYYNDNLTDKPREIDLIAEKAFTVNRYIGQPKGTVNLKLFIECKYISQSIVFWFHDKDINKAEQLTANLVQLDEKNTDTQKHHYLSSNKKVAKLFASEKPQQEDREIIYKAINQSLNAMVYFRNDDSILPENSQGRANILRTVNYPVILCNDFGTLFGVDIESEPKPFSLKDHFQLEINYAYIDSNKTHQNEYFIIDVVNFTTINSYLAMLDKDAEGINIS